MSDKWRTEEGIRKQSELKRLWYERKLAEDPDYNNKRYAKSGSNWRATRRMNNLNNKRVPEGEQKRPYLGVCEMCDQLLSDAPGKKSYHHWDGVADLGMWLCTGCHCAAERIDKELDVRYRTLKAQIEKEYAISQVQKLVDSGDIEVDILQQMSK